MTQWLIDTLIATSGLILLVLLIRNPVRRRFGASVAYGLWLLPALRLLMPPITQTVERTAPAMTDISLPLATVAEPVSVIAPTLIEQIGGWPTVMLAVWAAGAVVMLLYGTLIYHRQRGRVIGSGVQLARLGRIRILRSEAVRGPMAFGIVDPVIALPHDFETRYDERQRRLTLDHELAHHRSGDLVVNLIAYVLLCLQWFNPLAWAAHAAFRFDQEAACDARVLDMVDGPDRAAYGQAIAKAASGRALLFAGALDRPKTLSRRLQSMLISSHPRHRLLGRALILAGAAVALPLTATWATQYVDVEAPTPPVSPSPVHAVAPLAPVAPVSAAAAIAPAANVAPVEPSAPTPWAASEPIASANAQADANVSIAPQPDIAFIGRDSVRINGRTKRFSELTPQERAHIRNETNRAKIQLVRERAQMPKRLDEARRELEKFNNGEFEREMAAAQREVAEALREIDRNKDEMRRVGVDPERIKEAVRASLRDVPKIDVAKIRREAMSSINPSQIEASLREAERSLAEVEANLDRTENN